MDQGVLTMRFVILDSQGFGVPPLILWFPSLLYPVLCFFESISFYWHPKEFMLSMESSLVGGWHAASIFANIDKDGSGDVSSYETRI